MNNEEKVKIIKDMHEQEEALKCFVEIEKQKKAPTRDGMIQAIIKCQNCASDEIKQLEQQRCEYNHVSFVSASNEQLYDKMIECQQAIYCHCVNKLGEEIFKNLIKRMIT